MQQNSSITLYISNNYSVYYHLCVHVQVCVCVCVCVCVRECVCVCVSECVYV